jgi:hypothetical protein
MPRRPIAAKARFARLARTSLPRSPYAGFNAGGYGGQWSGVSALLPGARKDWLGAAGDLWRNSVVAACLGWLTDNFPDAILGTYGQGTPGKPPEPVPFAPLEDLIGPAGTPNPWYTTDELWAATVLSYKTDGNAYWIIVPGSGGAGEPVQLWWEPHFTVTPWRAVGSPNLVDKYYLWRPEGQVQLLPEQVVHFRDGLDPRDPTRGMARLKHCARNIVGLNDAETYTASIVGNLGALGVVWMPESGPGAMADIDEKDALRVASRLRQQMSRENAGKIGAINLPGKFERIGLGPQEMSLDSLPDRMEATVCAILGPSAQSIGLAVGNNTRTFTNLKESDKLSWRNGLIPAQNRMARQLTHQLLPRFFDVPAGLHLGWDRSGVEALQQDLAEAATAATTLAGGAVMDTDEVRARFFKLPPLPNDAGKTLSAPEPQPQPEEGDGGNGQGDGFGDPPPTGPTKARDGRAVEVLRSIGLSWDELATLRPRDLDELLTPAELGSLRLAPEGDAIKAVATAAHRQKKRAARGKDSPDHAAAGHRGGGQYDEAKHPRGPAGRFQPKPGADRRPDPRHVRLARAADAATRHHEALRRRGVAGPRYERALDRAITLKRAADAARRDRAGELFGLRKKQARSQGQLDLVPDRRPAPARGRHTPERDKAAGAIHRARSRQRNRTADGPDPATTADHPAGYIGELKSDLIHFDPQRFQYKLAQTDTHTGAVGSLAGVRKFDPELAGVVAVWKDPADAKVYVVNGHNRLDLARKLGVDKVAVRYLDAPDAQWARAKGALANIAEGRGTSIDAAKFFRDAQITSKADLQDRGIPLSEARTGEGLALAGLNNRLFGRVIDGSLKTSHGAIIGGAGISHEAQNSVADLVDKQKGKLNEGEIRELADDARHAGNRSKNDGPGLFGADDGPDEESLLLHRVKLIADVKQRLSREKNLFGTVGKKRAAETLSRAGNVIDAEASGAVSRDAAEALNVFDSLKRTSLFSGMVNDHAAKLAGAKGDKGRKQVHDDLYESIRSRVKDAYDLGK